MHEHGDARLERRHRHKSAIGTDKRLRFLCVRTFALTLVGGLSKIRQPRTPSARSDTRPPPPP